MILRSPSSPIICYALLVCLFGIVTHAVLSVQCNNLHSYACSVLIRYFPQSRESLAVDYINRARSIKDHDASLALQDINTALAIDPNQPQGHFYRGVLEYNARHMDASLAEFTRAIEIEPRYINAYENRGTVFGILGNYDLAIADFNMILKIKPYEALAYANKGYAELLAGNRVMGEIDIQKARSLGYTFRSDFRPAP